MSTPTASADRRSGRALRLRDAAPSTAGGQAVPERIRRRWSSAASPLTLRCPWLLVALLSAAPALAAQGPDGLDAPRRPPGTAEIHLVPLGGSGSDAPAEAAKVLVEGAPVEDASQEALPPGDWQLHVSVDLPLVRRRTLDAVTRALAERADDLAGHGRVWVSLRGSGRLVLLDGSDDPDAIAGALFEAGREEDGVGELFRLRESLRRELADAPSAEERRRLLVRHYHAEQAILEWQHLSLLDETLLENRPGWMGVVAGGADAPQALFLVRDDLGAPTLDFLADLLEETLQQRGRRRDGDADGEVALLRARLERLAEEARESRSGVARTLSAAGYALFPVTSDGGDARILDDAVAAELAAGNGRVVDVGGDDDHPSLDEALRSLGSAVTIRFGAPATQVASAGPASGELAAMNVRSPFRGESNRSLWWPKHPPRALTEARARRFLEGLDEGDLAVASGLLGAIGGGATLEAVLDVASLYPDADGPERLPTVDSGRFRVTVVRRLLDQSVDLEPLRSEDEPLDRRHWLVRAPVRISPDVDRVAVVLEDLQSGRWGAATAEEVPESLETGLDDPTAVTVAEAGSVVPARTRIASGGATPEREPGTASADLFGERPDPPPSGRFEAPILQIVPPAGESLTGRQRFAVLAASTAIRSVAFYLDGEEVGRDDRAPFSATVDLGAEPRERVVRIAGFSGSDLLLGTDEVRINRPSRRDGIVLTALEPDGAGNLAAEASLGLPEDAVLDRVEFYRNQALVATLTGAPLRATVGATPDADAAARGDFVRVVAWLADGTFLEDVRLLGTGAEGALGEEVRVNLVQVFAVVTDADGEPISGLGEDAFTIELDGAPVVIERFSEAEQVPIDLALVVDTSESMWALMDDTRRAAASFLGNTLDEGDRALLVDFDNTVRLVHPLSEDVFSLIRGLSKLRASGATALYDSIVFALVQLEEASRSRRAVVLLTDGDDFNSRFGYGRVEETARFAGVPLYFVALSDYFGEQRRGRRKTDLEAFADFSGGRVFYVQSMGEILTAYDRISRELRSQYLLTFSTDEPLTREQVEDLEVRLDREAGGGSRRVTVRWTVGANG